MHRMRFREIREHDVVSLFAVRVATRENRLSREQLAGLGINEKTVLAMLDTTHRGWLCEEDDQVVASPWAIVRMEKCGSSLSSQAMKEEASGQSF
jgi:hypothetical protein